MADQSEDSPTLSPYAKPGPYYTNLTPQQEAGFQSWVRKNNVPFDPSPTADYDMRGFYKGITSGDPEARTAQSQFDGKLHFSDKWKTPYHRTFSNESQYATANAPGWQGDRLVSKDGKIVADETPVASGDVWARAAARAGVAPPKPAAASSDDVWARAAARASGKTTAAPSADPGFQLAPSHIPQALQGNTNAPAIADMPAMSIPNGPANGSNPYVDAALKASRPGLDSKAGAASDVLRAAGSAVAPIAIGGGAIMAPLATAVGLGTGMAGQAGVEAALRAAGAGEGTSSLGGDIAGGILGGGAAKYAGEIPGLVSAATDAVKSKLPASLGGTPEWTDQHNFIMQGIRPGTNPVTFKQSLFRSMPDIKAAEVQLGKPIESIDDLIGDPSTGTPGAIKLAKQANREQFRSLFPPGSDQISADTTPVADAIRSKITPYMRKMNPGKAAELDSMASKYEGRNSIEDIDNFLQGANGQLDSYYAKNPAGRASAANNPDTAGHVAEAQALRKTLYNALDQPGQGEAAAELQKRYGSLSDFEQAAYKRKNVAERQAPENITQQLGNVAATMKGIKGMAKLVTMNPSGIVDIGEAIGGHKMANYMRELNSTNGLIERAFYGYQGTPSPINMPPRFNPTGFAPGFEQSGFKAPPKALDAGPIRMGTPDTSGPTQSEPQRPRKSWSIRHVNG